MTPDKGRRIAALRNQLQQSCSTLVGLATGFLADGDLNDREILFLHDWLRNNEEACSVWPGDVLKARLSAALADGTISDVERRDLANTLEQIAGGCLEAMASREAVNQMLFDDNQPVSFADKRFVLTGDFVFGPRNSCQRAIAARGGYVAANVSAKVDFLIVGDLGSPEWKHGTFGTKAEKAIEFQRAGVRLTIVREQAWAAALSAYPETSSA